MFAVDRKNISVGSVRKLSEVARRIGIHRECNRFEQLVEDIKKDKKWFLVDLVKSLKKVTDEWRGWKHQVFGMARSRPYVAAIHQVKELLLWTEQTYKESCVQTLKSSESYRKFTTETLRTFVKTCDTLRKLQDDFQKNILEPLKEFYTDVTAMRYIKKLNTLQMKWRRLLAPGAINSGMFLLGSAVYLKEAEVYESFHCFYLVLRLIPDLCFNATRCLELVRNCLDEENANAYRRERHFLVNIWMPKQREKQRQNDFEQRMRTLPERMKKIKNDLGCIIQEENDSIAKQNDLEQCLDELKKEERILTNKLGTYVKEINYHKKLVSDLFSERDVSLVKYRQLTEQVKTTQTQLPPISNNSSRKVENEDFSKWRHKLTTKLDLQESCKHQHEDIMLNIENYRTCIENKENEKVKIKFVLAKTKKRSTDISVEINWIKNKLDTLRNDRRNLQLQLKFVERF